MKVLVNDKRVGSKPVEHLEEDSRGVPLPSTVVPLPTGARLVTESIRLVLDGTGHRIRSPVTLLVTGQWYTFGY